MYAAATAVPVTLATGDGTALDAWAHWAVGTVRVTTERAGSARPLWWLVAVDVVTA